jgi:hypothetical protein
MHDEIWIIDTSAITEIRRKVPSEEQVIVFDELTSRVAAGTLTFPRQVFDEFERPRYKHTKDHGWDWVKKNVGHCRGHEPLHTYVQQVLSDPQVQRVLDPDKDHEEADPYLLALALKLRANGSKVGIITEMQGQGQRSFRLRTRVGSYE